MVHMHFHIKVLWMHDNVLPEFVLGFNIWEDPEQATFMMPSPPALTIMLGIMLFWGQKVFQCTNYNLLESQTSLRRKAVGHSETCIISCDLKCTSAAMLRNHVLSEMVRPFLRTAADKLTGEGKVVPKLFQGARKSGARTCRTRDIGPKVQTAGVMCSITRKCWHSPS